MANEPSPLEQTTIQQGNNATIKQAYSISGAKVRDENVLYLGIHGDTVRIVLCNDDAQDVITILEELLSQKELKNASPKSQAG